MSYTTPMQLLCEKAVQQIVTLASLCYVSFIYIKMNGLFYLFIFLCITSSAWTWGVKKYK